METTIGIERQISRDKQARNRWFLAYTLVNNPTLKNYRMFDKRARCFTEDENGIRYDQDDNFQINRENELLILL